METFFAVTAPGLAPLAAQELHSLGLLAAADLDAVRRASASSQDPGGVTFNGGSEALYRANLHLHTASRVLVRLGDFATVGFTELRRRAARLAWERFLAPGQPVALRVTCHKSRLYHSDAVAERVAAAIADRLGQPPEVRKFDEESEDNPPQLIVVRLLHDHCTISVDSSGALLHRRGYRLATAKAPLRESLAAAMLLAAGWYPPGEEAPPPLLDPFCGSGTIAIEAARLALGMAPGSGRRFAFMQWPGFAHDRWAALLAAAEAAASNRVARLAGRLQIQASDRDAGAVALARANAERAGVAGVIEFACRAVSAIEPPADPGWVVTNPPYGMRVGAGRDLRNLYAQFGNVLRRSCPGWQVALLGNDRQLLGQMGLRLEPRLALVNGGIPVQLLLGAVSQAA